LNFTFDGLASAERSLARIKEFLFRLKTASLSSGPSAKVSDALSAAQSQFEAGLDDDLNTAQALAAVFDLIRECNIALDGGGMRDENRWAILQWFSEVDARLAIVPKVEDQADDEIDALVAARNEARRNRDFAASDRIRRQLLDRGIIIEDTREGTKWRRR
jgi:cysteinyl-tRNA synthetase